MAARAAAERAGATPDSSIISDLPHRPQAATNPATCHELPCVDRRGRERIPFRCRLPKQYSLLHGKPAAAARDGARGVRPFRSTMTYVGLAQNDHWFDERRWPRKPNVTVLRCGGETRGELDTERARRDGGLAAPGATTGSSSTMRCGPVSTAHRCCGCCRASLSTTPSGGCSALPVASTLKRADEHARIDRTESRLEGLWNAQTPQMFRFGVLCRALDRAAPSNAFARRSARGGGARVQPRLIKGSTHQHQDHLSRRPAARGGDPVGRARTRPIRFGCPSSGASGVRGPDRDRLPLRAQVRRRRLAAVGRTNVIGDDRSNSCAMRSPFSVTVFWPST